MRRSLPRPGRPFDLALFALLGLGGAFAAPLLAHEVGAIEARGRFLRGGTFEVDLTVDSRHAPPPPAGDPAIGDVAIAGFETLTGADAALRPWFRALAGATAVLFDGQPAVSTFAVARPPADRDDPFAAPPRPVLRLSGRIPAGARTASLEVDLPIGSFPVALGEAGSQAGSDEAAIFRWTEGGASSEPVPLSSAVVPPSRADVARRYLALGFTHILPGGIDHILFVLGLFLLSLRLRPLLAQVTAFTLAHTLTLGLAMLGLVHLSPRIVEPLIAASIVYVAVENVFARELSRSRLGLVFAFGLLHGLGFASVLSELGLPRTEFAPALLSFNVGVELGQLTVLAAAFLLVGACRGAAWYRPRIAVPASLAIAAIGAYWAIERVFG